MKFIMVVESYIFTALLFLPANLIYDILQAGVILFHEMCSSDNPTPS